jgi:predicted MFS family arabinose efflux permease
MALAVGLRQAGGLFVSPLNSATGLGLATLGLLFATGQLALGLAQPLVGHLGDRFGAARVVALGALALAAATSTMSLPGWLALGPVPAAATLALAVVASAVANGAVGGNALLVGEVNRRVGPERAGFAVGLVGAGGSLGQLLLGPGTQAVIDGFGWAFALLASAGVALLAVALARLLRSPHGAATRLPLGDARAPLAGVLRDPRFLRVAASFGVCGFHVSFLAVHMPGVIERCGLPSSLAGPWLALAGAANIAGSLAVGHAMRRRDSTALLAALYGVRALGVAAFALATPSEATLWLFALVMGASHMATLPPTTQLVARHHGVARLGSLLGVVMLLHQVGGFLGIWLGGWVAEATGSDRLLWMTDIALALGAATLVWPLREPRAPSLRAAAAR